MSAFSYGFWLGLTGPIHLLSMRRYRKGERYDFVDAIGYVPIVIREDWTRWNSIRWRWKLWMGGRWMRMVKP